jgi:hypothetical protein
MSVTLFDAVHTRLRHVIPRFGLSYQADLILNMYALVCGDALAIPAGAQRPEHCRLNRDGAAIQFSLALARRREPALQFLGEAAPPTANNQQRYVSAIHVLRKAAELLGVHIDVSRLCTLLAAVGPPLDQITPEDGPGVFWIGASFPPAARPALTVYINARPGSLDERWRRIERFATHLAGPPCSHIRACLSDCMTPLGMAITLTGNKPPAGRMYFGAYGLPFDYYRNVLAETGGRVMTSLFDSYTAAVLGDELAYPSRAAVCSFEFDSDSGVNAKFELCSHCAYRSDAEACARFLEWIEAQSLDREPYLDLVKAFGGCTTGQTPELHAYAGIGVRHGEPYSTFYLNPAPGLSRA